MSNKAKETENTMITGEEVEVMLRPEARFHKYGQNLQCCFCKKVVTDLVGDCCGIVCWSHRFNHHFGSKQYEKARQIFAEINERRQQTMAKKFEVEPTDLPPTVKVETYPGYVFIDSENIISDEEETIQSAHDKIREIGEKEYKHQRLNVPTQLKGNYVVVDDIEHRDPAKAFYNQGTAEKPDWKGTMHPSLSLILSAQKGERGPAQKLIAEVGMDVIALLIRKNTDYGGSVFSSPILRPTLDPLVAIDVRMSDKIKRIANLLEKPSSDYSVTDESVEQTLDDLCGYIILRKVVKLLNSMEK